jgi:hypothetical protein
MNYDTSDIKNLKKIIHSRAIIPFQTSQGFEDANLIECTGKYCYNLKNINVNNTLIIDVDKFINLESCFSGQNEETKKPDYLIFTKDEEDNPLLVIIELKNKRKTKSLSYTAYQILGGINFCSIIIQYLNIYYQLDLSKYLKKIGSFKLLNKVPRKTTKITKNKIHPSKKYNLTHDNIQKNCMVVNGRTINFKSLLSQGKYINILD